MSGSGVLRGRNGRPAFGYDVDLQRIRSVVTTVRLIGLLFLALVSALGYGVYSGKIVVPDRWNPWAPLRLDEPLDWITRFKLARVSREPAKCRAILGEAQMRYSPVPDREIAQGCGIENAVRIEATSVAVGEPFTLSCRSALALALWERHVVQPAARTQFDATVKRLEHSEATRVVISMAARTRP